MRPTIARLLIFSLLALGVCFQPHAQQGETTSADAQATGAGPAEKARMLAEVLQDEKSRQALVDRLLEIAEGEAGAETAAAAPVAATGLVRQLANRSKRVAESLAGLVTAATDAIADVGTVFDGDVGDTLERTLDVARGLAVLIVVTLALFLVLRWVAARIFRVLARRAGEVGWLRTVMLVVLSTLIDALTAVGAWAAGYGVALGFGTSGSMDLPQSLFLNAFLTIELVKVAMRAVLSPRYAELRLLPMGDETAAYWGFWLSRLISLLGYGMLLVVPIVDARISTPAGAAVAMLVALTALTMAILIVLQNRRSVRDALSVRADQSHGKIETRFMAVLSRIWHLIAIVYLLALFVVWAARVEGGFAFMLWATLQTLVAIVLGTVVVRFISRWVSGGMRLSDDVRARLPLLEKRLNAYVPAILKVVRLVVMVGVLVAIAQAWQLVDFLAWIEGETGREVIARALSAFLVVIVALGVYLAVSSWVEYRLNPEFGSVPTARERTLFALFRNAFTIALAVITLMLVLAQIGVNIGPLLAGAGVLGLAIGFGAQKLVQDVITGAFIQLENAMNEGDVVTVGGTTGTVEKLTIRSVGLRDLHGVYHLIPFSSADSISNFTRGFSYAVAVIGVAYREKVSEVKQLMQEAFETLQAGEHGEKIMGPLEMHGVTELADSAVNVRARIKCQPGTQWGIGRAYNEIIKDLFDERGVEIPFPHVTVYMGEDKDGGAPALRVRGELALPSAGDGGAAAESARG